MIIDKVVGVCVAGNTGGVDHSFKPSNYVLNLAKNLENAKIGTEQIENGCDALYWAELSAIFNEKKLYFQSIDTFDTTTLTEKYGSRFRSQSERLDNDGVDRQIHQGMINYFLMLASITGRLSHTYQNIKKLEPNILFLNVGNADYFWRQKEILSKNNIALKEFVGYEKLPEKINAMKIFFESSSAEEMHSHFPRNKFINKPYCAGETEFGFELLDKDVCKSATDINAIDEDHQGYLNLCDLFLNDDALVKKMISLHQQGAGELSLATLKTIANDMWKKYSKPQ
jgi:hypothetical protein